MAERIRVLCAPAAMIVALMACAGCVQYTKNYNVRNDEAPRTLKRWWVGAKGYAAVIDIGFSGKGMQIEVIRSYLQHFRVATPIGVGWVHNYLVHLRATSEHRLILWNADGSETVFTPIDATTYTPPLNDPRILKEHGDGTFTLHEEQGRVFRFNGKGRLIHILGEEYGNEIFMEYNAEGYLHVIRDLLGHELTFVYDEETHYLTSIRDKRGRSASYMHDPIGNLTSVKNANGITSEYAYGYKSRLVSVTFPE